MATISNIAQARVIHFPWKKESVFGDDSKSWQELLNDYKTYLAKEKKEDFNENELSSAGAVDLSDYITDITYTKNLGASAGGFSITLANDRDWRKDIRVGTWIAVYMTQDGDLYSDKDNDLISSLKTIRPKLRFFGYVERVAMQGVQDDAKGAVDATFTITGRDFGIVYEQTDLWFSKLTDAQIIFTTIASSKLRPDASGEIRSVKELLEIIHTIIFSPTDYTNDFTAVRRFILSTLQWLMPNTLVEALGLELKYANEPYFGNIKNLLNFEETSCTGPLVNPLESLHGKAWDQLKAKSIESLHELFAELDDTGHPKLTYRPIPWRIVDNPVTASLFKNESKGLIYNLPKVELDTDNLISFDLGRDDHNRYNIFLTVTEHESAEALSFLNNEFPRSIPNSVKRHGARVSYNQIDALLNALPNGNKKEKPDTTLLLKYNKLMREYWEIAPNLDSGSIVMVAKNSLKLGKTLYLDNSVKFLGQKLYYIEGYTDSFTVDIEKGAAEWIQTVNVTRGMPYINESSFKIGLDFSAEEQTYTGFGDFTSINKKRGSK